MFLNSLGVYLTPENLIWISGVIGFLLPHVAAIIIQSHWKESFKSGLVFLLCCVAAVITCSRPSEQTGLLHQKELGDSS